MILAPLFLRLPARPDGRGRRLNIRSIRARLLEATNAALLKRYAAPDAMRSDIAAVESRAFPNEDVDPRLEALRNTLNHDRRHVAKDTAASKKEFARSN